MACISELVHLPQWLLMCIYSAWYREEEEWGENYIHMVHLTCLSVMLSSLQIRMYYLAMSPRNMFKRTVSAISSALCPVTSLSTFNSAAPRSRALNTEKLPWCNLLVLKACLAQGLPTEKLIFLENVWLKVGKSCESHGLCGWK